MFRACSPTLITALTNTHQRLQELLNDGETNRQQVLEAAASWMVWAMAVDEAFWGDGYEEGRNQDPIGRAVLGLRHAWNRLKHDAKKIDELVLVQQAQGRTYPRRYPYSYRDMCWAKTLPCGHHEDEFQAYMALLAGQPIRHLASDITGYLQAVADPGGA